MCVSSVLFDADLYCISPRSTQQKKKTVPIEFEVNALTQTHIHTHTQRAVKTTLFKLEPLHELFVTDE